MTDATIPLSREEVLRVLQDSPEPLTKRDLARVFRVKGHDRTELKRVLRELEAEGLLERGRGRRMRGAGRLPEVVVLEVIGPDEDGDLFARPVARGGETGGEDDGVPPPRVLLPGDQLGRKAPGPGDRVLARVRRSEEGGYEGRVMRVLPSPSTIPGRVMGVLEASGEGLRLRPLERAAKQEFAVSQPEAKGASPGEVVVAEVQPGRRALGLARARVVERIGSVDDPRAISLMAALAHDLPIDFPPEASEQAERALPVALDGRLDLRDLPLVTIDGPDARDFDDAVHALPDDDPKNPGGWQIVVAIADVAHYVRPGDALDREAYRRGNSVYFPDRVLPMLPHALSNGLCSLRPDEDRACLAVRMWLDAKGNKLRHRFTRGLMRSRARLTYEQVQAAHDGAPDEVTAPLMDAVVKPLYGASTALSAARHRRGTLDLDIPERQVVLDEEGRPIAIRPRPRLDAHRLIEEFMIAANVAAAESLERAGIPLLYRVHDKPDALKVEALAQFLDALGIQWGKGGLGRPRDFGRLVAQMDGHELSAVISEAVLRVQSQAVYSPRNLGHFGLNLGRYAHFTSPIRRYADLIVHRALIRGLKLGGGGGLPEGVAVDDLHEVGEAISRTERRAMAAERSAISRYTALLMADKVGAIFDGRISGVQRFGVFVTLAETGADGFIPVSTLGNDFYHFDSLRQALVGERFGEAFGLGDRVRVELAEADAATGGLLFRLIDHEPGVAAKVAARSQGRQRGGGPGARSRQRRPTAGRLRRGR